MSEKLGKDDKNRLAKWRQRLQRHFWSETDEAIFQKILDMNEAQAEPSEEHTAVFPGIGAVKLSKKPELRGLTIEEVVKKYPEQVAKAIKEAPMRKPKVSRELIKKYADILNITKMMEFSQETIVSELIDMLEEVGCEVEKWKP